MQQQTCKNCPDRHPACHDTCTAYQKAKAERDAINAERRRQNDITHAIIDGVVKSVKRRNERRK